MNKITQKVWVTVLIVIFIIVIGLTVWNYFDRKRMVRINEGSENNSSKTYSDSQFGFKFEYPSYLIDLGEQQFTSYLVGPNSDFKTLKLLAIPGKSEGRDGMGISGHLQISVGTSSPAIASCLAVPQGGSEGFGAKAVASRVDINGINFTKYSISDAGLGNRFAETAYVTLRNNVCYKIEVIESGRGFSAGANIDKRTAEVEKIKYGFPFSAWDVFDQLNPVVQKFKFTI